MIKYILVSLLIAYLIRKIFPPIIYYRDPREFDENNKNNSSYRSNEKRVSKKKPDNQEYTDYEEVE
jgi:hypothetical protein